MKDSELKQIVIDELNTEKDIDIANIVVLVQNQVVTLMGSQKSLIALNSIENSVKSVGGVKAVVMEMDIKSDHELPDDKTLALTIIRLMELNPSIPEKQIQIVVESGVVSLTGSVQHHHERVLVRSYIEALKGVSKVIDNIQIATVTTDGAIEETFMAAMKRRAAIDESNIQFDVVRGVVYLDGVVRNLPEKESVVDTAWSVPGVQFIIDRMEIADVLSSKY